MKIFFLSFVLFNLYAQDKVFFNTEEITSCGKYQIAASIISENKKNIVKIFPKTLKEVEFYLEGYLPLEYRTDGKHYYFLEVDLNSLEIPKMKLVKAIKAIGHTTALENAIKLINKFECL